MKRLIFVIPALLLAYSSARAAPDTPSQCSIPEEFTTSEDSLAHVRAAISAKEPVDVLAVGSGTTVGHDLVPQGTSFPYRMIQDLQRALPGVPLKVTVVGGRGLAASEMLELLRTMLKGQHFTLVLWQTGTVEAARGLPPAEFGAVLAEGLDAIQAQGGDALLIDPQFSRFLKENADLEPYEDVFREAAARPGVIAFRRFELMQRWAESGELDLEHVAKEDRGPALDTLHGCLGLALSRLVAAASGVTAPVR